MNYPTIQTGIKNSRFEWVPEEQYTTPIEGFVCKVNRWAIVRNGCILVFKDLYPQISINRAVLEYSLEYGSFKTEIDMDGTELKLYEVLYVKESNQ